MRENSRVRERFELSLDGKQVASIVVGALVVLGAVFVLGLNVGRQLAPRAAPAPRAEGSLAALERPPEPPPPREKEPKLQFHDALTKGSAEAPPIPEPRAAPSPGEPATGTALNAHPPAPVPAARPAPAQPAKEAAARKEPPARKESPARKEAAQGKDAVAAAVAKVQALPRVAVPAAAGRFAIQVGATQTEADARRLAARYEADGARVVPADVPGRGKVWRVKVGSFATRAEAERRLEALKRAGVKGFVTEAG
jgi:cell division septation protein DedD